MINHLKQDIRSSYNIRNRRYIATLISHITLKSSKAQESYLKFEFELVRFKALGEEICVDEEARMRGGDEEQK